jgi:hypothetical protein
MRFELEWRDRRIGSTPRRFLDYIVDGESLYDRHGYDFVSCLGWFMVEEDERAAGRLLGAEPPDAFDGSVAVYVCPECGDLLCGALTAFISREGDEVVWRDLAYITPDWSEWVASNEAWSRGPADGLEELRFPATDYIKAITDRPGVSRKSS